MVAMAKDSPILRLFSWVSSCSAPMLCTISGGSIWERIVKHKLPVVEPRESADFPLAAQDFRDKLNDPTASGAIFLAVCRCSASAAKACNDC